MEYCGHCVCNTCANDVNAMNCDVPKEQDFACFNCDDCYAYNGERKYKLLCKDECDKYKEIKYVSEQRVLKNRAKLALVGSD